MLARLSSDVPEGTKIVILQFGGNDFKQKNAGSADMHEDNIASVQQQLRKRGIRTLNAQPLIRSVRAAGFVQADQTHLTAEGYRRVAAQLLPLIH
jgi:acyl-CoA thioesterase-1